MVLPSIHELEKVVRHTYFGPKIVHIRGCIDVGIYNLACINDFLILFFLSSHLLLSTEFRIIHMYGLK